jgi:hypothetical protein
MTADPASPQLLKGLCRLQFEGQEFTSADVRDHGTVLWLETSDEVLSQFASALDEPAPGLEFIGDFEAEFLGFVHWYPEGTGHLRNYPGSVSVQRVISAHQLVVRGERPRWSAGSIRERLLMHRHQRSE